MSSLYHNFPIDPDLICKFLQNTQSDDTDAFAQLVFRLRGELPTAPAQAGGDWQQVNRIWQSIAAPLVAMVESGDEQKRASALFTLSEIVKPPPIHVSGSGKSLVEKNSNRSTHTMSKISTLEAEGHA